MYENLSSSVSNKILNDRKKDNFSPFAFLDDNAIRRFDNPHDHSNAIRSPFIRDIDKIMHCPYYSRYADKTQVFSLLKNDDISHRSLHVQLVSRTARTIGKALGLNLDLIEAIALGHDLGHTPFGHTGEKLLDEILVSKNKGHFYHNFQSVRVLDKIFPLNITLQTLYGIISHDGENEVRTLPITPVSDFKTLDGLISSARFDENLKKSVMPTTLEGAVVRVADIISYLGKDRTDAEKINLIKQNEFENQIGSVNAEILNNLLVDVIETSYGKNYIGFSEKYFSALKGAKADNYSKIYLNPELKKQTETLKEMMIKLFDKLLDDLNNKNYDSPIYTQHIAYVDKPYYKRQTAYLHEEPELIVSDYIASMTDDYFCDLYAHLFNGLYPLKYKGYFE